MREIISLLVLYAAVKLGGINYFFLSVSMLVSFLALVYLFLSLLERWIIGDRWFRITPGMPQLPPFEEEENPPEEASSSAPPEETPPPAN